MTAGHLCELVEGGARIAAGGAPCALCTLEHRLRAVEGDAHLGEEPGAAYGVPPPFDLALGAPSCD